MSNGHNSATLTHDQSHKLAGFVNELEKLAAERAQINADISQTMKAAREQGFDAKAISEVLKRRKREPEQLSLFDAAVENYTRVLERA